MCTLADNKKCLSLFKSMNFNIMLGYIILNTNYYDLKQNYELLRNSEFSLLHNFINCLQVNYNTPIYYKLEEDGLLNDNFSFKTNGYDYHCIDDRTDKIFRFIKDNFLDSEICNKDFQFHNHLTHIFYLLKFSFPLSIPIIKLTNPAFLRYFKISRSSSFSPKLSDLINARNDNL